MINIFIIGAKSIGAYGGYETFVDKLTEYHSSNNKIHYHVACKANGDGYMDETKLDEVDSVVKDQFGNVKEFTYHNARCFKIPVPEIGNAQAIYYDIKALDECCRYVKENNIQDFKVYILACRIGLIIKKYYKKIHDLGGEVYLNPDGHEWKRKKWPLPIRWYWKMSESRMVKFSDLVICDSVNIEKYILDSYKKYNPKTTFIAYGAEFRESINADERYDKWKRFKKVSEKQYYLVVGRFVPENNYEVMIREFMKSNSTKDFVIITNVNDKFLNKLERKLHFKKDKRIKFVGTVYDKELLMKIRQEAYAYFHGHEVGGTNPSLLEALGSTNLNLLLNVGFNREVADDGALYWTKEKDNLKNLIEKADSLSMVEIEEYGLRAKKRIMDYYSWPYICDKYEKVFLRKG